MKHSGNIAEPQRFTYRSTAQLTCSNRFTDRASLDRSLQTYIQDHFASSASACAVFSSTPPDVPVSAASTIATEDAEEEQAILGQENDASETTTVTEEETKSIDESEETALDPSATTEAGPSDGEGGDSLITKVVETIKDVVTAPLEEHGSEEDGNRTPIVQPVEPLKQETPPGNGAQAEITSQEGESLPANNLDLDTSGQAQAVQAGPLAEPTYTIAIVSNKYKTQNFW